MRCSARDVPKAPLATGRDAEARHRAKGVVVAGLALGAGRDPEVREGGYPATRSPRR